MEVLFQFYLWDQSQVTIVWNTRETGDINNTGQTGDMNTVFNTTTLFHHSTVQRYKVVQGHLVSLEQRPALSGC